MIFHGIDMHRPLVVHCSILGRSIQVTYGVNNLPMLLESCPKHTTEDCQMGVDEKLGKRCEQVMDILYESER